MARGDGRRQAVRMFRPILPPDELRSRHASSGSKGGARAMPSSKLRQCPAPRAPRRRATWTALIAAGAGFVAAPVPATGGAAAPSDGCSALELGAVAAIQQTAVVAATGARRELGDRVVASCFVRSADPARSVSFEIVNPRESASGSARARWRTLFHRSRAEAAEEKARRPRRLAVGAAPAAAATADRSAALPVTGLGEEAYFVGTAAYGALYVLDGASYFRLSVGGPGDLDLKLGRARALAEDVLRRLDADRLPPERAARAAEPFDAPPSSQRGEP